MQGFGAVGRWDQNGVFPSSFLLVRHLQGLCDKRISKTDTAPAHLCDQWRDMRYMTQLLGFDQQTHYARCRQP